MMIFLMNRNQYLGDDDADFPNIMNRNQYLGDDDDDFPNEPKPVPWR